ncbi:MAG TPA: hypothetical protein VGI14_05660 [Casimicrobiaceae bacterium]|jgi:ElaB/YqjD/DUF883 family membrane-anchored ribosome-binding protein
MATTANTVGNATRQDSATDRMQGALDDLSQTASESVDRWSDAAQDTVQRVSDNASEYASRLGERGARLADDTRDYISAHPMRTLAIAAAAGFLIGRMLR